MLSHVQRSCNQGIYGKSASAAASDDRKHVTVVVAIQGSGTDNQSQLSASADIPVEGLYMTYSEPRQPAVSIDSSSAGGTDCISQEELQDYLAGWSDDFESARIENHLAGCSGCEQVLRRLEVRSDTLVQSLQSTAVESSGPAAEPTDIDDADPVVSAAVARSKELMDAAPGPSELQRPSAVRLPGQQLGVYELLRPLGRGGMGAVYLASHSQLHRQVAIKLLPVISANDADVRARFQREIRIIGRLNHPSIVAATDADEIDGTQFLVMEYVPGMDLSRLARLLGRIPMPEACELMRQVALGLSCAHADGVVHRDVKPSNLMLDESGQVKILDFGLAQLSFWDEASVDLTTVGQLMGTLDYMAPEQAEFAGGVDYRADLYSLGATLFRLLCGRPPLAAAPNQSPLEKLRLLANHLPPKLDTLCPDAPAELVMLVTSLLAHSPQDRPASAAHAAEQLAPFAQSADLVGLLGQARDAEARLPQTPGDDGLPPGLSEHQQAEVQGSGGGSSSVRRWIMAAAALPLMILAGILIKLESDKGQLVIESEVADVSVRIVRDQKPVDEFSIQHGATATRLRAGQYEVVIDGPSDGLTIENGQFTLQNGATVVARIRLNAAAEAATKSYTGGHTESPPANAEPELLYEGNSLSEWLDLLRRERSANGLKSAFVACQALVSPQTSDQITRVLLKTIPGLDGTLNLDPGQTGQGNTIDGFAAEVLRRANPGPAYYQLWVREFESAEEPWQQRLWSYLYYEDYQDAATIEPFVVWAERYVSSPSSQPVIADSGYEKAADALRLIADAAEGDSARIQRILSALKSSPLGPEWWLSQPLVSSDDVFDDAFDAAGRDVFDAVGGRKEKETDLWPPAWKAAIVQTAIQVLEDWEADRTLLAQACMILANGADLSQEQQSRVVVAANRHLVKICTDEQALMEVLLTGDNFSRLATPHLRPPYQSRTRFSSFKHQSATYLVLKLLDVFQTIQEFNGVQEGLRAAVKLTSGTNQILKQQLQEPAAGGFPGSEMGGMGGFGSPSLALAWPELIPVKTIEGVWSGQQIWGAHKPTPRDWLMFCIVRHPILKEDIPEPPMLVP